VLALCRGLRWPSLDLLTDDVWFEKAEFLFAETEPRMFLPDAVLSKPMAPAADPFASFSAVLSSSLRDSLSHQNSHDLESRERPLADLCKPWDEEKSGAVVWLRVTSGSIIVCFGRGGDGDEASFVIISALPSAFIDNRTHDETLLSWRSDLSGQALAGEGCPGILWRREDMLRRFAMYPMGVRVFWAEDNEEDSAEGAAVAAGADDEGGPMDTSCCASGMLVGAAVVDIQAESSVLTALTSPEASLPVDASGLSLRDSSLSTPLSYRTSPSASWLDLMALDEFPTRD
jgi:hypothetical protein